MGVCKLLQSSVFEILLFASLKTYTKTRTLTPGDFPFTHTPLLYCKELEKRGILATWNNATAKYEREDQYMVLKYADQAKHYSMFLRLWP